MAQIVIKLFDAAARMMTEVQKGLERALGLGPTDAAGHYAALDAANPFWDFSFDAAGDGLTSERYDHSSLDL